MEVPADFPTYTFVKPMQEPGWHVRTWRATTEDEMRLAAPRWPRLATGDPRPTNAVIGSKPALRRTCAFVPV
jgi:hypothetical protein